MPRCICRLSVSAALAIAFLAGGSAPPAQAAATSDQPAQERQPAKPMIKKEPMAGEMKKDGMMKEDVSKAAQKWNAKMDESMKREKVSSRPAPALLWHPNIIRNPIPCTFNRSPAQHAGRQREAPQVCK